MNKLSGKDTLLLVVSTVVLGLLSVILSEHGGLNAVLVGLAGGISAQWVQVNVLRRELNQLRQQLRTNQTLEHTHAS